MQPNLVAAFRKLNPKFSIMYFYQAVNRKLITLSPWTKGMVSSKDLAISKAKSQGNLIIINNKLISPSMRSRLVNKHRNILLMYFQLFVKDGVYLMFMHNSFLHCSSSQLLLTLHSLLKRSEHFRDSRRLSDALPVSHTIRGKLQTKTMSQQLGKEFINRFGLEQDSRKEAIAFITLIQRYNLRSYLQSVYQKDDEAKLRALVRMMKGTSLDSQGRKMIKDWIKIEGISSLPRLSLLLN